MTAPRYPKPALLERMSDSRHYAVEASAGTGKTFLMERRIADLILSGSATIDEILVVTFTEKATAELRRRIRGFLVELYTLEDHRCDEAQPHWLIDAAARQRLQAALNATDRATITTIHGFCHRILSETAFQGGRLFDETQVPDELAFSEAFLATLRDTFAVDASLKPFLIAWLRQNRSVVDLRKLLFRCAQLRGDFTPRYDQAALEQALASAERVLVGQHASGLGLKGQKVKAVDRRLEGIGRAVEAWRKSGHPADALPLLQELDVPYLVSNLSGAEQAAARELVERAMPLSSAIAQAFLPVLEQRLAEHKAQNGQFDFLDMLKHTWAALAGRRGQAVGDAIRNRYRHALIDEFQDTDEIQWNIFRSLFLREASENSLTVVGDPKQAIYGFRGADLPVYQGAVQEILRAGGEALCLEVNYRSSPAMVESLNHLFGAGEPFFAGGITFSPVAAGRKLDLVDEAGRTAAPICKLRVDATGKLKADPVRHAICQGIAEEIARLLRDPAARLSVVDEDSGSRSAVGASDIFVLTRSTQEAEDIAAALRARGLPCALYQQEGLFQTQEAAHVRDLLAAIAEPTNRALRLRAWQSDFFSVPWAELPRAGQVADAHPLVGLFLEWHWLAQQREYEQLFAAILAGTRLIERLAFLETGQRALENYLHLFEILESEILASRGELHELVGKLESFISDTEGWDSAERNLQRLESTGSAVQIMTMHKAKGLEAAVVFLMGGYGRSSAASQVRVLHEHGERKLCLAGAATPEQEAIAALESEAEDQRLMYVAATRARVRLYLPEVPADVLAINGAYAPLARRLDLLRDACVVPIEARPSEAMTAPPDQTAQTLSSWSPPALPFRRIDEPLPAARRGRLITSYSRMKERDYETVDVAALATPLSPEQLPGGRMSGIFLHAILEEIPLSSLRDRPEFSEWREHPDVLALFRRHLENHDVDPRHLVEVQRLVHRALTLPLELGDVRVPNLLAADRERREVEFLCPARAADGQPPTLIKGFIDMLFEAQGRYYVLDWKSDVLADYAPECLARHVTEHYALQAEVYGMAVRRALDPSATFGGTVFLFLRGPGAHFVPWQEKAS